MLAYSSLATHRSKAFNSEVTRKTYFLLRYAKEEGKWADQIKENEVGGACGTHGRGKKRVRGFGGRARRKTPFGRPRCRWEERIKIDLREIGWGGCGVASPGSG
jgi:hypothetical protein